MTKRTLLLILLLGLLVLAGCDNMHEQPKLDEPYSASETFGTAAREILPEAVAIGHLRDDEHLYEGTMDGALADELPFELTEDVLLRGKDQFEAFCTPCHGHSGYGDGVVSLEGFPPPASYHTEELRAQPVGHFFQVITDGVGVMYSYASRIAPEDRWAIAAYIKALQLSQNATLDDLPDELQSAFADEN